MDAYMETTTLHLSPTGYCLHTAQNIAEDPSFPAMMSGIMDISA